MDKRPYVLGRLQLTPGLFSLFPYQLLLNTCHMGCEYHISYLKSVMGKAYWPLSWYRELGRAVTSAHCVREFAVS